MSSDNLRREQYLADLKKICSMAAGRRFLRELLTESNFGEAVSPNLPERQAAWQNGLQYIGIGIFNDVARHAPKALAEICAGKGEK